MMSFDDVVRELQSRPDCHFRPATGFPNIPRGLQLPPDLSEFYSRFSEARLFSDDGYDPRCHILPPAEFVQVGEAIMAKPTTAGIEHSWYTLAHVQDGNYLGIDLLPQRLGRCYDCFHETYGSPGYCTVIALSFTELLNHLARAGGEAFWLSEDFRGYGDAYEGNG
ncbi:MAG TPA: SMI1/KNR4 family protein [Pirellulaceae bacterium]|jgi:hypothetical protein